MKKHQFKTVIDAPKEKVWEALWEDKNYRNWTSAFHEGSRAESDWKKGSKILFTDGKGSGMLAKIAENIPNEFMSFEHLGMVQDGVEDTTSEKVKAWAGAHEDYKLKTVDGKTELTVEMDMNDEMLDFFKDVWPKALDKLKTIAEQN